MRSALGFIRLSHNTTTHLPLSQRTSSAPRISAQSAPSAVRSPKGNRQPPPVHKSMLAQYHTKQLDKTHKNLGPPSYPHTPMNPDRGAHHKPPFRQGTARRDASDRASASRRWMGKAWIDRLTTRGTGKGTRIPSGRPPGMECSGAGTARRQTLEKSGGVRRGKERTVQAQTSAAEHAGIAESGYWHVSNVVGSPKYCQCLVSSLLYSHF